MARPSKAASKRFVKGLMARGAVDPQTAKEVLRSLDTKRLHIPTRTRNGPVRDGGCTYVCENVSRGSWTVTHEAADGTKSELASPGWRGWTSFKQIKDHLRTLHFGPRPE